VELIRSLKKRHLPKEDDMNRTIRDMNDARKYAVGEMYFGRLTLVLHRHPRKPDRTEICPFCGCYHIHGSGDGHRTPHCATNKYGCEFVMGGDVIFKNKDGEVFDAKDGYILRSID